MRVPAECQPGVTGHGEAAEPSRIAPMDLFGNLQRRFEVVQGKERFCEQQAHVVLGRRFRVGGEEHVVCVLVRRQFPRLGGTVEVEPPQVVAIGHAAERVDPLLEFGNQPVRLGEINLDRRRFEQDRFGLGRSSFRPRQTFHDPGQTDDESGRQNDRGRTDHSDGSSHRVEGAGTTRHPHPHIPIG